MKSPAAAYLPESRIGLQIALAPLHENVAAVNEHLLIAHKDLTFSLEDSGT